MALLLVGAAACLWRGYAAIMAVHLDVLTQTAAKLCAVVESGRGPTAEGMAEYFYPAKRGREFLRQFEKYRARRSHQEFAALLERYEAMLKDADTMRAQGGDRQAAWARLQAQRDVLQQLADEIRAVLKAER